MTKSDLAKHLARQARLSRAEAADRLDRLVHQIVTNLRQGQPVRLPGLGSFSPGSKWEFRFDSGVGARGKRAK